MSSFSKTKVKLAIVQERYYVVKEMLLELGQIYMPDRSTQDHNIMMLQLEAKILERRLKNLELRVQYEPEGET